jgi:hypothetical protein
MTLEVVLSPVLGLRAQVKAAEPVSVRPINRARGEIYAVRVPINRWATNEMTANSSRR